MPSKTVQEDIERANKIIREECIPACREKFLYVRMSTKVFEAVLTISRAILQSHADKGELSLDGIDVNVQPTIEGHLSIWAAESQDEGYVN